MDDRGWTKTKTGRVVYDRPKHPFDILRIRKIFEKDRRHWDSGYYNKTNLDYNLTIIYQQILDYWELKPPENFPARVPPEPPPRSVFPGDTTMLLPNLQVYNEDAQIDKGLMQEIDEEIQELSKDMLEDILDLFPLIPEYLVRPLADLLYDSVHDALSSVITKLLRSL